MKQYRIRLLKNNCIVQKKSGLLWLTEKESGLSGLVPIEFKSIEEANNFIKTNTIKGKTKC